MYIISALIVMAIEFVIEYLLKITLGKGITNMFIIGYVLIGVLLGGVIKSTLIKHNKKNNVFVIFMSIILLTINYIGIEYVDYKTEYYKGGQVQTYCIFKSDNGEHVSNYGYEKDGVFIRFTFINYEKYMLDNARLSIGIDVDINDNNNATPTANRIMMIVDYLLILVLGLIVVIDNNKIKSKELEKYY